MKECGMLNLKVKKVEQLVIFLSLISNLIIYDFFSPESNNNSIVFYIKHIYDTDELAADSCSK